MHTPTQHLIPTQERRKERTEAWLHPITGAVSIVRITRDAEGFGDVQQLALIERGKAMPNEFADCQFAPLD